MRRRNITNLSNDLIFHTYYKMDINQKKIVYYLLSQIDTKNQKNFHRQVVSLNEIIAVLGLTRSGKAYQELGETIEDLITKYISFYNDIEIQGYRFKNMVTWFTEINFIKPNNRILVEFVLNPKMKPLLLHLQQFVQLPHHELMQLKGGYAIDLYIYCKAIRDKTRKSTPIVSVTSFDLDKLKLKLGLENQQYKRYNDFKRRVIEKAIDEINQKSQLLRIEYIERKVKIGRTRKVIGFEFYIYDKEKGEELSQQLTKQIETQIEQLPYAKYRAYNFLLEYGIYEDKAYEIIQKIQGSTLIGFEDLFIEKAIQHFETKTKATIDQKAATFVIWFFRGAFEVGTSEWSMFVEQIVQIQKQMEKEEPEKYENRLLSVNMPHQVFIEQVKSKIKVKL